MLRLFRMLRMFRILRLLHILRSALRRMLWQIGRVQSRMPKVLHRMLSPVLHTMLSPVLHRMLSQVLHRMLWQTAVRQLHTVPLGLHRMWSSGQQPADIASAGRQPWSMMA